MTTKSRKLKFPKTEEMTLKWLWENVPLRVWLTFFALLGAAFTFGFSINSTPIIKTMFASNQKIQAKYEELNNQIEKLNSELKIQKESNSKNETAKKTEFDTLQNKIKSQSAETNKLRKENLLLRTEIDNLKKIKGVKPTNKNNRITADQILASISGMYVSTVDDFLIEVIPKLGGGISCEKLSTMLNSVGYSDRSTVIKNIASYVKKPISPTCLSKLSQQMYASDSASAISALLKNNKQ